MFMGASSFNHPLNTSGNNWNVSNVTDMWGMFMDARSFNQPLNDWNVSNVTDMRGMFHNATSFNQPLHAPWWPCERAYDHEESESDEESHWWAESDEESE